MALAAQQQQPELIKSQQPFTISLAATADTAHNREVTATGAAASQKLRISHETPAQHSKQG
jgi:hypothetical protein